jgi:hypothetical protein
MQLKRSALATQLSRSTQEIYVLNASFGYPQLTELTTQQVPNNQSQNLIAQKPTQTSALTFLSYTTKLLADGGSLRISVVTR